MSERLNAGLRHAMAREMAYDEAEARAVAEAYVMGRRAREAGRERKPPSFLVPELDGLECSAWLDGYDEEPAR